MLRHIFAIALHLLLNSFFKVFVGRTHHHGLTLESRKQAHLPLLARSRQISLGEKKRKEKRNIAIIQI